VIRRPIPERDRMVSLQIHQPFSNRFIKLMPKPNYRACLDEGLRLDLYWLIRQGWLKPDQAITLTFQWRLPLDEEPSTGLLTADMRDNAGSLRIQLGAVDQTIELRWRHRHFGGRQWYFLCPVTKKRAWILWLPPGARRFASALGWKNQAGYASQFQTRRDRRGSTDQAGARRTRLGRARWN
jgi:hypothetical protein